MSEVVVTPTGFSVHRAGEGIWSEGSIQVAIEDEGAGAFVVITTETNEKGRIAIDFDEWPILDAAVRDLISRQSEVTK